MTKILENQKTITINGVEVTIKKLPIRRLTSVLEALSKLPADVMNMKNVGENSNDIEVVQNLANVIAMALPEFAGIIASTIDDENITAEFILDECGVDEGLDLITAVLEVNNIAGILERIKKIQALSRTVKK